MGCFTGCDGVHEGFMGPKHLELAPLLIQKIQFIHLKIWSVSSQNSLGVYLGCQHKTTSFDYV